MFDIVNDIILKFPAMFSLYKNIKTHLLFAHEIDNFQMF